MPRGARLRELNSADEQFRRTAARRPLPETREEALSHVAAERRDHYESLMLSESVSKYEAQTFRTRLEAVIYLADILKLAEPGPDTSIRPDKGEDPTSHTYYLAQLLTPAKWREDVGEGLAKIRDAALYGFKKKEDEEWNLWVARESNLILRFLEEVEKGGKVAASKMRQEQMSNEARRQKSG